MKNLLMLRFSCCGRDGARPSSHFFGHFIEGVQLADHNATAAKISSLLEDSGVDHHQAFPVNTHRIQIDFHDLGMFLGNLR